MKVFQLYNKHNRKCCVLAETEDEAKKIAHASRFGTSPANLVAVDINTKFLSDYPDFAERLPSLKPGRISHYFKGPYRVWKTYTGA